MSDETAKAKQAEKAKESEKKDEKAPPRPMPEIQADLQQTRERLSNTIAQLKEETQPKALLAKAQEKVKSVFVDEDGKVKPQPVAITAGVVVSLIVLRRGLRASAKRRELRRLSEVVWVPVPRASVSAEVAANARNAKELAPLTEEYAPAIAIEA